MSSHFWDSMQLIAKLLALVSMIISFLATKCFRIGGVVKTLMSSLIAFCSSGPHLHPQSFFVRSVSGWVMEVNFLMSLLWKLAKPMKTLRPQRIFGAAHSPTEFVVVLDTWISFPSTMKPKKSVSGTWNWRLGPVTAKLYWAN